MRTHIYLLLIPNHLNAFKGRPSTILWLAHRWMGNGPFHTSHHACLHLSSYPSTVLPLPSLKVRCGRDLTLAPESEGESACLPRAFLRELTRVLRVPVLEGVQTFSFASRQTTIARNLTLWSVLWDLSQWSAIGSSESQARFEREACAIYFPHFCNVWNVDHKQAEFLKLKYLAVPSFMSPSCKWWHRRGTSSLQIMPVLAGLT